MEYDTTKKYWLYYHYMHDHPSEIVKMVIPGALMKRTLELIKKDPAVIIGDIKELHEESAE